MFRCLRILGDFYVVLMHTMKLLTDICFVSIVNEWCHNLIMST